MLHLYPVKRALLSPRTAYRRFRHRHLPRAERAVFDALDYSNAINRFSVRYALGNFLVEADLTQDSVVVDVGAFRGEWSEEIRKRYAPTIYAFEPNPRCFPALRKRFADDPKVHLFPYGLSDCNSRAELILKEAGSSVFRAHHRGFRKLESAAIELRDAAETFDELDIERVDLLKINIEGGEYNLLDHLIATGKIQHCKELRIQFHEWYKAAWWRRHRIRKQLRKTHRLDWDYPYVWENWSLVENR